MLSLIHFAYWWEPESWRRFKDEETEKSYSQGSTGIWHNRRWWSIQKYTWAQGCLSLVLFLWMMVIVSFLDSVMFFCQLCLLFVADQFKLQIYCWEQICPSGGQRLNYGLRSKRNPFLTFFWDIDITWLIGIEFHWSSSSHIKRVAIQEVGVYYVYHLSYRLFSMKVRKENFDNLSCFPEKSILRMIYLLVDMPLLATL